MPKSKKDQTNWTATVIRQLEQNIRQVFDAGLGNKWVRTWSYNADRKDFSRQVTDELMSLRFHATCEETGDDIFISIQRVPRGV